MHVRCSERLYARSVRECGVRCAISGGLAQVAVATGVRPPRGRPASLTRPSSRLPEPRRSRPSGRLTLQTRVKGNICVRVARAWCRHAGGRVAPRGGGCGRSRVGGCTGHHGVCVGTHGGLPEAAGTLPRLCLRSV
eukprot:300571-Chlamydomonas_euryale.AAC.24